MENKSNTLTRNNEVSDVLSNASAVIAPSEISAPVARALADALQKIAVYVPTTYVDDTEPDIDAEHLNHAEQAIKKVTDLANGAVDVIKNLQTQIAQLNSGLQGIYDSGPAPYATDLLAIPFGKMYKYSPDTLNIPASGQYGVAFKFGNNVSDSGTGQWEYIIAYSTENPSKAYIRNKINAGQWTGWVSYVTNSDLSFSLSTDILSYALSDSCKTGFSSGAFTGSGYTGALPDINLKYGTWEINKRSANTITVKAFSPYKSTMWVNSYVNTAGWSGWKNCITNSDLAVLGFPIAVQVTDLHSIDKSCIFYYLSGAANAPLSSSGGMGICIYQNYDWITLIVIPYSVTKIYVAEKRTTWSAWDGPK